ncbi:hypothetical protein ACKLNO_09400 [Neisseriaceae bacterium B1]
MANNLTEHAASLLGGVNNSTQGAALAKKANDAEKENKANKQLENNTKAGISAINAAVDIGGLVAIGEASTKWEQPQTDSVL